MSGIRSFIAIDLPPKIQKRLNNVSDQLQNRLESVPVRWVPVENIHLTLKFLGDVSESNLEVLKDVLRTVVSGHQTFEISIGGLGAFPKAKRPRVIWIGVEAPQNLSAVQHSIEAETTRLGYAPEKRPFSPHLTLGRVSRNANSRDIRQVAEVLNSSKVGYLGVARIQAVHLYRSDLQPGGAVYSGLFTAPLSI
ncbi:MAG TPA: RNA 2',3'-cyclic phosphodiesterase [Anaerolineales bacterium]|jgi:2'-5' RNA ligase|nr:RNA 2',3'-cyclic phosphodiesterase [Anaerolineales bacterium]